MAKRKRGQEREVELGPVVIKGTNGTKHLVPPLESPRYMTGLRYGKISSEVFAKKPERRLELGLPAIPREGDI